MGLVTYEVVGFGYVLARANDMLNYRRVLGFRVLGPGTSKRCQYRVVKRLGKVWLRGLGEYYVRAVSFRCGRRAAVGVLVEIRDRKFMVYLCPAHFRRFLDNVVRYVEERVERAYRLVAEELERVNPLADAEDISVFFQGNE
jgi:hypothetical protein